MLYDAITDVEGIKVGHAGDMSALTGCTVILCEKEAVGGLEIRGSASGTRAVDALRPDHLVNEVNAVLLTGGSAFGLDATGGVMEYLEEKGKGFQTSTTKVPIVPTAVIYDLGLGDYRIRPDKKMGYQACKNASSGKVEEGSVGAGIGAAAGKLLGIKQATKGGIGTAGTRLPDGLVVGGLVVVNAFGDVIDNETGKILAGARTSEEGKDFVNSFEEIKKGAIRKIYPFQNTTLGVIATNAALSKGEAAKVAQMAFSGLVKTISPINSLFDGDLIFVLSLGKHEVNINTLGLLSEEAIIKSVKRAVMKAEGFGVIPACRDLINS